MAPEAAGAAVSALSSAGRMKNQTVVVTGATGGIGRGLVQGLLERGYGKVAAVYRSHDRAAGLRSAFESFAMDPAKHVFSADLSKESEVLACMQAVAASLGPVAGLVNNAGTTSNGMSWKLSAEEFLRVQEVNLFAPFFTCKAVLPGMRERDFGRIVNISSVVSMTGVPGTAHYAASKSALNGLTRAVASETANKNITVNAVALGYFEAGMIETVPEPIRASILQTIPKKRFGRVAEVAALVDFLLNSESEYLTGQVLHINGGLY